MYRMMHHRRSAHRGCCAPREVLPARFVRGYHYYPGDDPGWGSGAFGVRRPLRFLAWKLKLTPKQVAEVAAILSDLKTERAQDAVEDRRALALLADAVAGEAFNTERAQEAAAVRTKSAERLELAVATALGRLHAALEPEQRERLAYLLRTGTLTM